MATRQNKNASDKGTEVEGWTDADMQPYQPPATDLSFQELIDAGVIDVQEVDDVIQLDKEKLVGQPFIIVGVRWGTSTFSKGEKFAVVHVVTPQVRGFFVDGSTGICDQLQKYEDKMTRNGMDTDEWRMLVRAGLRASHYTYEDPQGNQIPATTYYIDNRDV